MDTFQEFISNSTPANRYIVEALGIVKGIVACKVIYACNLKDRVCRYGIVRMSQELGIDKSTVSRSLEWLTDNGYIIQEKEPTKTTTGHYTPTEKLIDLLVPVAERNSAVAERNTPVALCNQDKNQITDSNKENTLSPKKNGKSIPIKDPLSDIQSFAIRGVSEATAPNPQDQYWQYRDEALKAASVISFWPNNVEKDDICSLAAESTFDLQTWVSALAETARHYSGGGKIARAIEVYRAGGTYAAWREKNYPQQQKGSNHNANFGRNNQVGTKPNGRTIPNSCGLGELAIPPTPGEPNPAGA